MMLRVTHRFGLAYEVAVLEQFAEEKCEYRRPPDNPDMWELDRLTLVQARLEACGFKLKLHDGETVCTRS